LRARDVGVPGLLNEKSTFRAVMPEYESLAVRQALKVLLVQYDALSPPVEGCGAVVEGELLASGVVAVNKDQVPSP